MQSFRNLARKVNPFARSHRELLDYYVNHPTELWSPIANMWVDVKRLDGVADAINSLPDSQAYLRSLPGRELSDDYTEYVRKKAIREMQTDFPEQYDAAQRLQRLFNEYSQYHPLTSEQQAELDRDWAILTTDQLRDAFRQIFIIDSYILDYPRDRLYQEAYDRLNNVSHDFQPHPHPVIPLQSAEWILNNPSTYWENILLRREAYADLYMVDTNTLIRWMVDIPGVDRTRVISMSKPELIRYFDTLVIDRYNRKRDQALVEIRRDMEAGHIDDYDLTRYLKYLTRNDVLELLDEFGIEHDFIFIPQDAIAPILRYLDIYLPIEKRRYPQAPITLRKQP